MQQYPTPQNNNGGWNSFRIVTLLLLIFICLSVFVQGCMGLSVIGKLNKFGNATPDVSETTDSAAVDSVAVDSAYSYETLDSTASYDSSYDSSAVSVENYAPQLPD